MPDWGQIYNNMQYSEEWESVRNAANQAQEQINQDRINQEQDIAAYQDHDVDDEINPLDPVVYFDPSFVQPIIANIVPNMYNEDNTIVNTQTGSYNEEYKISGITIPVIQLGPMILDEALLKTFILDYQYITPILYLEIYNVKGNKRCKPNLNINSVIRISFRPREDGRYKKIAWEFQPISQSTSSNGVTTIISKFKFSPMLNPPTELHTSMPDEDEEGNPVKRSNGILEFWGHQMKSVDKNTHEEKLGEYIHSSLGSTDKKLNCWKALYACAESMGLGFASSPMCIDDENAKVIFTQNRPMYLIIQDIIRSLGDQNHIYDAWVDPYGYLVLVNLAHIFNTEVDGSKLIVDSSTGMHSWAFQGPHENYVKVSRVITNYRKTCAPSDMQFYDDPIFLNNFEAAEQNGTNKTLQFVKMDDGSIQDKKEEEEKKAQETQQIDNPESVGQTTEGEKTDAPTDNQENNQEEGKENTEIQLKLKNAIIELNNCKKEADFQINYYNDKINSIQNELNDLEKSISDLYDERDELTENLEDDPENEKYIQQLAELNKLIDKSLNDYNSLSNDHTTFSESEHKMNTFLPNLDTCISNINDCLNTEIIDENSAQTVLDNYQDTYNDYLLLKDFSLTYNIQYEQPLEEVIDENDVAVVSPEESDIDKPEDTNEEKDIIAPEDENMSNEENNNGLKQIDIMTNTGATITEAFKSTMNLYNEVSMNGSDKQTIQRNISKAYIQNKRMQKLRVILKSINFGLQRGQWIQVALFNNSMAEKLRDQHSYKAYPIPGDKERFIWAVRDIPSGSKSHMAIAADDNAETNDVDTSDLYYIDGMAFEYYERSKLKQVLYLIKRSRIDI